MDETWRSMITVISPEIFFYSVWIWYCIYKIVSSVGIYCIRLFSLQSLCRSGAEEGERWNICLNDDYFALVDVKFVIGQKIIVFIDVQPILRVDKRRRYDRWLNFVRNAINMIYSFFKVAIEYLSLSITLHVCHISVILLISNEMKGRWDFPGTCISFKPSMKKFSETSRTRSELSLEFHGFSLDINHHQVHISSIHLTLCQPKRLLDEYMATFFVRKLYLGFASHRVLSSSVYMLIKSLTDTLQKYSCSSTYRSKYIMNAILCHVKGSVVEMNFDDECLPQFPSLIENIKFDAKLAIIPYISFGIKEVDVEVVNLSLLRQILYFSSCKFAFIRRKFDWNIIENQMENSVVVMDQKIRINAVLVPSSAGVDKAREMLAVLGNIQALEVLVKECFLHFRSTQARKKSADVSSLTFNQCAHDSLA